MKIKKILIKSVIIVFCFIVVFINNSSSKVIERSFKYLNSNNIDGVLSNYTDRYKDVEFNIENIENINLISKNLINDKDEYETYSKDFNIDVKYIKIFNVKYKLKLKDDNIGPEPSGVYEKKYILIKESFFNEWKINDVGY